MSAIAVLKLPAILTPVRRDLIEEGKEAYFEYSDRRLPSFL